MMKCFIIARKIGKRYKWFNIYNRREVEEHPERFEVIYEGNDFWKCQQGCNKINHTSERRHTRYIKDKEKKSGERTITVS